MKVWVVCSGEYSDRGIEAVFSSEEMATAYATPLTVGDTLDITEYDVDCETLGPVGEKSWEAYVEVVTGNVCSVRQVESVPREISVQNIWQGKIYEADMPVRLCATMWARDESHAIKVAGELRQKWVANPQNSGEFLMARDHQPKICGSCFGDYYYCKLSPGHTEEHLDKYGRRWK